MNNVIFGLGSRRVAVASVVISCFVIFLLPAVAQQQGQNAVYNSNTQQGSVMASPAFIDASMFANGTLDFCGVLKQVLANVLGQPPYTYGAVIDARGLPYSTPSTSMICQASPWANIANPIPSTILLPAGTIYITKSWVLPNGTRVIGEGSMNPYNTTPVFPQTVIEACTPSTCNSQSFSDNTMIQFGSPSRQPVLLPESLYWSNLGRCDPERQRVGDWGHCELLCARVELCGCPILNGAFCATLG